MNNMMYVFLLSRLMALLIIPALFSVLTVSKILSIRKTTGSIIFRKRQISWFNLSMFITGSIIFSYFIDIDSIFLSLGIYLLFIIIFYGAYFEKFVESLECGIYEQGIVYPGYTASWSEIEGFIDKNPIIRLVHTKKGAFDFKIDNGNYNEYIGKIKNHTVIIGE